jgi:hypothetical protein
MVSAKICPICNNEFSSTRTSHIYCSKICYRKSSKNKEYAKKYSKTEKYKKIKREYAKKYKYIESEETKNKDRLRRKTEKYKKYNREYVKKRKQNDYNFYLKTKLNKRMWFLIKKSNGVKSLKLIELLGCTIEFFKNYIEAQFKEGMTWGNYGKKGWHIDHIIPVCNFNLTKEEEQKKCFHYTNLQPLWWFDNLKKGSKH